MEYRIYHVQYDSERGGDASLWIADADRPEPDWADFELFAPGRFNARKPETNMAFERVRDMEAVVNRIAAIDPESEELTRFIEHRRMPPTAAEQFEALKPVCRNAIVERGRIADHPDAICHVDLEGADIIDDGQFIYARIDGCEYHAVPRDEVEDLVYRADSDPAPSPEAR